MAFQKQLGPVLISEAAGVVTISLALAETVGGGSLADVAKASVSASAEISAIQLVDAGLMAAESKYPSLAIEIAALKALIDAAAAQA